MTAFKLPKLSKKPFYVWSLAIFAVLVLTISTASSKYFCLDCPANFFCINDIKYPCPTERPVTAGAEATSEEQCITCIERDGNTNTPIFDKDLNECVSCAFADENNPVWGKNSCTTCVSVYPETPVYDALAQTPGCVTCAEYNASTPKWNGTDCIACATFNEETPMWNGSTCISCVTYSRSTPAWDGTQCVSCESFDSATPMWNGTTCAACPVVRPLWNGTKCTTCPGEDMAYIPSTKKCEVVSISTFAPESVYQAISVGKDTYEYVMGTEIITPQDEYAINVHNYWQGAYNKCNGNLPSKQDLANIAQALYGDASIGATTDKENLITASTVLKTALGITSGCVSYLSSEYDLNESIFKNDDSSENFQQNVYYIREFCPTSTRVYKAIGWKVDNTSNNTFTKAGSYKAYCK